jgi:Ulp1 family protease
MGACHDSAGGRGPSCCAQGKHGYRQPVLHVLDKVAYVTLQTIPRARLPVRLKDLRTLKDGTWINDEVFNDSMALLQAHVQHVLCM